MPIRRDVRTIVRTEFEPSRWPTRTIDPNKQSVIVSNEERHRRHKFLARPRQGCDPSYEQRNREKSIASTLGLSDIREPILRDVHGVPVLIGRLTDNHGRRISPRCKVVGLGDVDRNEDRRNRQGCKRPQPKTGTPDNDAGAVDPSILGQDPQQRHSGFDH